MWQKLPQNSFNIMKYGWMEVFRLFRGFRMQTRKNCQPQSHLSVIECLKGHFRLKIQAFRNSAFLLLQRSKEIKVVAFSMYWEKPRSCARDSGICCEDCWSWNKLKLSVSSCLAYKRSLCWRDGHSLKPGATAGGKKLKCVRASGVIFGWL